MRSSSQADEELRVLFGNSYTLEMSKKYSPGKKNRILLKCDEETIAPMKLNFDAILSQVESESAASSTVADYDVYVTDISDQNLVDIGTHLGYPRLSISSQAAIPYPVNGVMFGHGMRWFIPLVVSLRNKHTNVAFMVDPGSPTTFLRRDTVTTLFENYENVPENPLVRINGSEKPFTVGISRAHFESVDLLGQDFMDAMCLEVNMNYRTREITVNL